MANARHIIFTAILNVNLNGYSTSSVFVIGSFKTAQINDKQFWKSVKKEAPFELPRLINLNLFF